MERLSKDAATLLHALYSQFLSRRKVGQSKSEAKEFSSAESIKDDFNFQMSTADVADLMWELSRVGYLNTLDYEDSIEQCELTDNAITDCENINVDKAHALVDGVISLCYSRYADVTV